MKKLVLVVGWVVWSACSVGWAGTFDGVDVKYWAGSGASEAVVVIDFGPGHNYAFGYSWDGNATGWDALAAIDAAGSVNVDATWSVDFQSHFISNFGYPGATKGTGITWGYYGSTNGSSWSAWGVGADGRALVNGDYDGWSWGNCDTSTWAHLRPPTTPMKSPRVILDVSFTAGQDVQTDLGFTVEANSASSGTVEIISDSNYAPTGVLRMADSVGNPVSIAKSVEMDLLLDVEFDYRFLTDGKLKVMVGGATAATIPSPASGEGRDSFAHFDQTFDLSALGVSVGDNTFALELTNLGDPEILLDDLNVTTIPEPATIAVLALAGAALLRKRRRRD